MSKITQQKFILFRNDIKLNFCGLQVLGLGVPYSERLIKISGAIYDFSQSHTLRKTGGGVRAARDGTERNELRLLPDPYFGGRNEQMLEVKSRLIDPEPGRGRDAEDV